MTDKTIKVEMPGEARELPALMRAVDKAKPDPEAVDKLRAYLVANPHVADALGNLADITTRELAKRSFGDTPTRLAILTQLETMRDGLGYVEASELERSLIAHLVLCWLRLHDCELRYQTAQAESMTLTKADWWERKLAHNQRRYLKACETLARVRKLLVEPEPKPSPAFTMLLKQQLG